MSRAGRAAALFGLLMAGPALAAPPAAPTLAFSSAAQPVVARLADLLRTGNSLGRPGEWVVYRIGATSPLFLRLAVLSRTVVPAPSTWVQVNFGTAPEGGILAMKLQLADTAIDGRRVLGGRYRFMGGPLSELDTETLKEVVGEPDPGGPDPSRLVRSSTRGPETRLTTLGPFVSLGVDTGTGMLMWVSPEAPGCHLVLLESDRGLRMELYSAGTDAVDELENPPSARGPGRSDGGALDAGGAAASGLMTDAGARGDAGSPRDGGRP